MTAVTECPFPKAPDRLAYTSRDAQHPAGAQPTSIQRGGGGLWDTKKMTLRLPREQAADVEALARVEGVTVTQEIRRALVDRIEAKRQDAAPPRSRPAQWSPC